MVTRNLKGISLRSALNLMLAGIDAQLTYVTQDEVLLITTKDKAFTIKETRLYDARALGETGGGLVQLLRGVLEYHLPGMEPFVGIHGTRLVVSATLPEHAFLSNFLAELRRTAE
jgi:hypothetical protein